MEPAQTESDMEIGGGETPTAPNSLFPVASGRPAAAAAAAADEPPPPAQWLYNRSFTADLASINDAVSSQQNLNYPLHLSESEEEGGKETIESNTGLQSYGLVKSSSDIDSDGKRDNEGEKKKKQKNKKKRKRLSSSSRDAATAKSSRTAYNYDATSRKSNVSSWATSSSSVDAKGYYFDSRGDRDNLAFGCLYRMDVARFKPYSSMKSNELNDQGLRQWNQRSLAFDGDTDIDALDKKLKAKRYWSAKYSALERHKNLKRIRIVVPKSSSITIADDFIPLLDDQVSHKGIDDSSLSRASVVEESWEDSVLHKTREFNKLSREHPNDEKVWLAFAEFQDKVASMQPQKGARLQTLEKKISILEKATELNPENEELLLHLMNAYQSRDSVDVFIGRWKKILTQHSGSYRLWKEFLRVAQGEFSRFKVSEMRKIYANAIQALSSVCSRLYRQLHQIAHTPSFDPAIVQQELGLVDIFLSLCRFEWQAGYQELATALFQAEIEYSLFCPSLFLTEQNKRRLFEHFWNSNGARVGEDGAFGWSTWLEKEEEQRKKVISDESSNENEEGGWTGWSQPVSNSKDITSSEDIVNDDLALEEIDGELETKPIEQKDDTEALLKMLGIDADTDPNSEVKDTTTWTRWSKEELLRDADQWMPVHANSAGISDGDGTPDRGGDGQLSRVILFEDVGECLFSIISEEARLSLIFQFIDFYGGRISKWTCTNSSSWAEQSLSLVALPDSILDNLRKVHDGITKKERSPTNFSVEFLLDSSHDVPMRTDMMRFVRNATLLCLTAFPHNYVLEEAALVAEEQLNAKVDSHSCSVTPCRTLAKTLIKRNRQDVLLCGVYARREAAYGNIDHARKVFDMALASIEVLPSQDHQSNIYLLYFWYAEVEIGNSSGSDSESSLRAIHILCCFGNGIKYSPFKCQPSSLQQLRARQGFKERIRMLRSTWARGVIDDCSIALICSAALFEELMTGCMAAIEVLNQAFSVVLPERRSQSFQLEFLYNYYVRMLCKHHAELRLSKVWESIVQGLQIYPYNPELYGSLIEISHLHTANKLRWIFDNYCQKKPSVIIWLFALSFEISRGGSQHRIHGLFERAFGNEMLRNSAILWRYYIAYEANVACNPSAARRIFFRAIHACPWSKKLWLDGFVKLHAVLTAKELSDLQEVMRDKELNLRTDIYEILLQDEIQL